jgi:hypothetical protein
VVTRRCSVAPPRPWVIGRRWAGPEGVEPSGKKACRAWRCRKEVARMWPTRNEKQPELTMKKKDAECSDGARNKW